MSGALVPCVRVLPVSFCGVLSGGRFEGAGERVLTPSTETAPFFAGGGRTGFELGVSRRLRMHWDAEVLSNFTRATLKVGPEIVWRAPPVAVALAAGMSFEL
ncbi:MAG: hypothetical protein KF764_19075 [Labilithrix sp.]|nr:hypothetical protein [Labilithrix sp.]